MAANSDAACATPTTSANATTTTTNVSASTSSDSVQIQIPIPFPFLLPPPEFVMQLLSHQKKWDPDVSPDWDEQKLKRDSMLRILRDVQDFKKDPLPGIFVEQEEENLTKVHALIVGPRKTPYDGGFFYLKMRFPPDYPHRPPKVKLLTTGGGVVRFNPNLYANGMVCISMLGTWDGPSWTPAQCLITVLTEIQSVMNKEPYDNEPDLEKLGKNSEHRDRYTDFVRHETLRVAVCQMMENPPVGMPDSLQTEMKKLFLNSFDFYVRVAERNCKLDGKIMLVDAYGREGGKFCFKAVKEKLEEIHSKLLKESTAEDEQAAAS